jgi:hypothetical protein
MKTLTINDLGVTRELDRGAMAAVRGGHGSSQPSWFPQYEPTKSSSLDATQDLTQL